jgi:hypothetical protein
VGGELGNHEGHECQARTDGDVDDEEEQDETEVADNRRGKLTSTMAPMAGICYRIHRSQAMVMRGIIQIDAKRVAKEEVGKGPAAEELAEERACYDEGQTDQQYSADLNRGVRSIRSGRRRNVETCQSWAALSMSMTSYHVWATITASPMDYGESCCSPLQ